MHMVEKNSTAKPPCKDWKTNDFSTLNLVSSPPDTYSATNSAYQFFQGNSMCNISIYNDYEVVWQTFLDCAPFAMHCSKLFTNKNLSNHYYHYLTEVETEVQVYELDLGSR